MATLDLLTVSDVLQLSAIVTVGTAIVGLAGASGWYLRGQRGRRQVPPAVEESALLDLEQVRLAYHVGYRRGYEAGYQRHQEDADLYLRLVGTAGAGADAGDTTARPARPGALPTVSGVLAEAERILQAARRRRPGAPGAPRP